MRIPTEVVAALAFNLGMALWINRTQDKLITELIDDRQVLMGEISYMCHILNENSIKLDEFDLIALPHVTRLIDMIDEAP